jgi:hypothetical protein
VTLQIILVFTFSLTHPKTFTGPCKCIWKIFTLALCKCKNIYIHSNRISVSVKNLDMLSVNHLHLHGIYMPYIWLLTLTHTTLEGTSLVWLFDFKLLNKQVTLENHDYTPKSVFRGFHTLE